MAALAQHRRQLWAAAARHVRGAGSLAGVTMPSSSSLWDIVKQDLWESHDSRHIFDIWTEFHSDPAKQRVATVMTAVQYLQFAGRAAESPAFVVPVPRGPGAFENFMVQCQLPHALLTSLEDFKRHGPSATPHFSLTYYRELEESKGLVLVRGDITQPDALTVEQAAALMRDVHDFYTDAARYALVHAFNHRPAEFDFARVLEALGHGGGAAPAGA